MRQRTDSGLLKAAKNGQASILAVFGGQGTHNLTALGELRTLYLTYRPLLEELITSASQTLKRTASGSDTSHHFIPHGFDLILWLQHPELAPSATFLATAPVSFPMNGLLSFAHYCVACHVLGLHPGQFRDALTGTTGHSQGIIVAAAVSGSGSWKVFLDAVDDAMKLLFWLGYESHYGTPHHESNCLSSATSMLSVRGMKKELVERILEECNFQLSEDEKAYMALVNCADSVVISGPEKSLDGLRTILEQHGTTVNSNQNKIPYPDRRPVLDCQFLPISAAFHSPHLYRAYRRICERFDSAGLFKRLDFTIPIYHTYTGEDIHLPLRDDCIPILARAILCEPVDWAKTCMRTSTSHILDFGPGKTSLLAHDHLTGSGRRIILASESMASSHSVGGKNELFSPQPPIMNENWAKCYGPRLVTNEFGRTRLITRMCSTLGAPPVMVAGMTPTTSAPDFVACIMNAGYHVELACGGYSQPQDLQQAIEQLVASMPKARGITCNVIYANPRAISWQIPLLCRLRAEGYPIEGLCIGAGVPSPEVAKEYIETLGLKHISFKPSSVDSILQVLDIAKMNASTPVLLQWTGGRAGGHHSYDDLHEPLIKTYGSIRKYTNVTLIIGSGFGDGQGMMPYLTGEWAETRGYPRMPVDGVLLGSRMMVAKEAHTSNAVKALIVQTQGVTDAEWHKTYSGPAGGVITVRSEMGEPIHKIANRAVMLWDDLDRSLFNVKDREQYMQLLKKRRAEIISRLNSDYAKPWFAVNSLGSPVGLEDMTYAECLQRVIALMYMHSQKQWVHESYRAFFLDLVDRIRERFNVEDELCLDSSLNPSDFLEKLFTVCPALITDILYPEDVAFFMSLCKRRGQKPVNFIPVLDANFETWFKKDSLWQMEKLEAVIDQDPERVCIIHGPVAARFSTSVDESAADILNRIHDETVDAIRPIVSSSCNFELDGESSHLDVPPSGLSSRLDFADISTRATELGIQVDCKFTKPLPKGGSRLLLEVLDIGTDHWLSACLNEETVFVDRQRRPNRVLAAFLPRAGDRVTVQYQSARRGCLSLSLFSIIPGQTDAHSTLSLASTDGSLIRFDLRGSEQLTSALSLDLELKCAGNQRTLHDTTQDSETKMRRFYASCWSVDGEEATEDSIGAELTTGPVVLSSRLVLDFVSLISRAKGHYVHPHVLNMAPLDVGIIVAWEALSRSLLNPGLGGDLSRLLHISNTFELIPGMEPLRVGDLLKTTSRITAVTIKPQGKLVEVTVVIKREEAPIMKITSEFLIQGQFPHHHQSFRSSEANEWTLTLDSPRAVALLRSRPWFKPDAKCPELLGKTLLFRITFHRSYSQSSKTFTLNTSGAVSLVVNGRESDSCIGNVSFSHGSCSGDPVIDFLSRHGSPWRKIQPLEHPGWLNVEPLFLQVPNFGLEYSALSTDHNPIHVSPYFAGFAGLSTTIVHGMYTSAVVRSMIEDHLASMSCTKFRRWSTTFEDVVRGGDRLRIELQHKGMISGNMALVVQVWNEATSTKVLSAEAEVEQAPTAYLFCGQGSQKKGMGMALYETDGSAKSVWDRGDRYLFELYGFSLLDIVRNNPKSLTVHFGTKKGRQIRAHYLALTRTEVINGREITVPVIDGLSESSSSITFEEPNGLLFSTQFAQPAISLMNIAESSALKARGLFQQGAAFAGHSLGEYSALLACADFMSLENLLSLTFYRGLLMQNQMSRDAAGQTDFSMVAVNPSRVRQGFDEASLNIVVKAIASSTELLLEVVNYNVAGQQYVCAGHLRALWLLQKVCDELGSALQLHSPTSEEVRVVINRHLSTATALPEPIQLQRGRATIPLPGVNVPFHSSYLRGGIAMYRRYLQSKIRKEDIAVDRLVGKFIPNLTGKPFSISREYVEEVARATGSKFLQEMLVDWAR